MIDPPTALSVGAAIFLPGWALVLTAPTLRKPQLLRGGEPLG